MTPAQWTKYVETTKRKKARLALASGTDGASSRFTKTLINVLQKQQGVVPASRIHREVVNAITAGQPRHLGRPDVRAAAVGLPRRSRFPLRA